MEPRVSADVEVREAFRIFGTGANASVALQGLSLAVERGEIVVVLGPSGSGKTTLLRAIGGFEPLSAGSVVVRGTDLGSLSAKAMSVFRAETFGFLDQHYARALSPDLSCRHTVALQLELLGHESTDAARIADRLLDRVGLGDRGDDRPRELSGGEQQRVAVCAAVAHSPRVLLVDEPAGELDAGNAATIYELLAEIARESHASAVVVSHDTAATRIADRLVRIRDGRVVEEGAPGDEPSLVVSRGWVHLPGSMDATRERRLVSAERRPGEIVLREPEEATTPTPLAPRAKLEPSAADARVTDASRVAAELRSVGKVYPAGDAVRVVLADVDAAFERGVFAAVVGRSGTGKSTLLHILAGLEPATTGGVFVLGEALGEASRAALAAMRRRSIALVTQEPGLVPHLSALENVELGLTVRGAESAAGAAASALEHVGLGHKLGQRARSLSAGERERVAIARAIAADVPILLIDEPTARLDEDNGLRVGMLLADAAASRHIAVVCATHDPVLIELADQVVDLEDRACNRVALSDDVCAVPRADRA
jgi:ABC-type lipoprotein export system ATPase subunit